MNAEKTALWEHGYKQVHVKLLYIVLPLFIVNMEKGDGKMGKYFGSHL
jgi:hypothetical protein